MKVQFKMPRSLDGVNYSKGVHEVPDSLASHWYFLAMIQNGVAVILEAAGKKQPEAPMVPEKPIEKPEETPSVPNYHEHMAQWESEQDKKNKIETKVENHVVEDKTSKRKEAAAKAAATRAANKAKSKEVGK